MTPRKAVHILTCFAMRGTEDDAGRLVILDAARSVAEAVGAIELAHHAAQTAAFVRESENARHEAKKRQVRFRLFLEEIRMTLEGGDGHE